MFALKGICIFCFTEFVVQRRYNHSRVEPQWLSNWDNSDSFNYNFKRLIGLNLNNFGEIYISQGLDWAFLSLDYSISVFCDLAYS